jgi:hypothetical protein
VVETPAEQATPTPLIDLLVAAGIDEPMAVAYLISLKWLKEGQLLADLDANKGRAIRQNVKGFAAKATVLAQTQATAVPVIEGEVAQ